jgi:hypothetical protein
MNRKRNITPPAKCAVVVDNPPTAVLKVVNGDTGGCVPADAAADAAVDDGDNVDDACAMIIYL